MTDKPFAPHPQPDAGRWAPRSGREENLAETRAPSFGQGSRRTHALGIRRFLLASLAVFAVGKVWGGLVHLVVLPEANAAIAHLLRPDMVGKMGMSIVASAGFAVLFVPGYGHFARKGTVSKGVLYGLFFTAVAGLLVDLNQYVLHPIPGSLACT